MHSLLHSFGEGVVFPFFLVEPLVTVQWYAQPTLTVQVNNEYAIMFKRGAFELGTCICPVSSLVGGSLVLIYISCNNECTRTRLCGM